MFSTLLPSACSSFELWTPIRPSTMSHGFVLRAWSMIFWKGLPSSSVFLISMPVSLDHPLADFEMRLIDLRQAGIDDLLVELVLLLEAEHLRRLLGEDVDDAVEDRVMQVRVVDGDHFDLLAERCAPGRGRS